MIDVVERCRGRESCDASNGGESERGTIKNNARGRERVKVSKMMK
jgi:hypothetical protein